MKIIEVIADAGHLDTLQALSGEPGVVNVWWSAVDDQGRRAFRLLVQPGARQAVMDTLQRLFSGTEGTRILVLPVEATLPRSDEQEESEPRHAAGPTREELYESIAKGARIDGNFLLLVALSTVVAAIGLIEDNVAVVIGAMVIAPLLGPNLALALGTALGDLDLMGQALRAGVAGALLALSIAFLIGYFWPQPIESAELLARADVGLDSVALALASGAAAVLSLTTGISTVLVGVMVAVALLPPTAATGLFLGGAEFSLALDAALLFAVNVVSVNLAAKVVFLVKGVKPRTWIAKRQARQSMWLYIAIWCVTLAVLVAVIFAREPRLLPL